MRIVEKLPSYGIHYYDVKVKCLLFAQWLSVSKCNNACRGGVSPFSRAFNMAGIFFTALQKLNDIPRTVVYGGKLLPFICDVSYIASNVLSL